MSWFCGRSTRSRTVALAGRVSMNSRASATSSQRRPAWAATRRSISLFLFVEHNARRQGADADIMRRDLAADAMHEGLDGVLAGAVDRLPMDGLMAGNRASKERGERDFLGLSEAAGGDFGAGAFTLFARPADLGQFGFHHGGRNAVRRNAARAPFRRQAISHSQKAGLAGAIGDVFGNADDAGLRGNGDDAAPIGLDQVAVALGLISAEETVAAAMEALMLREPGHWQKYYDGDAAELRL